MSTLTAVPAPTQAEPARASLAARLGAEVFGTFALVLAIVGVGLYNNLSNSSLTLATALAGGLTVAAVYAGFGHVSGGHFNPAATLGLTLAGRSRWADLLPYWVAQLVGGILAAWALFLTIPDKLSTLQGLANDRELVGTVANTFGTHSTMYRITQQASDQVGPNLTQALLVEALVTAVFVGVFIAVTDKRAKTALAPVAIGFALFAGLLVAGPLTNGSLNPARSTATAIFSPGGVGGIFTGSHVSGQLWVFWVGPLLGALIAGLCFLAFAAPRTAVVEPAEDDALAADETEAAADKPVADEAVADEAVVTAAAPAAADGSDPLAADPLAGLAGDAPEAGKSSADDER